MILSIFKFEKIIEEVLMNNRKKRVRRYYKYFNDKSI